MDIKRLQVNNQSHDGLPHQFNALEDQAISKAPSTLLVKLEAQIAQYKSNLATPLSVEQIQQALQSEHWEIRSTAIERISAQDSGEIYSLLEQAAHDEHRFVRMATLRVLAHREDTATSRSMLARGLHDDDWQVREAAIQVLGLLARPTCLELVKTALHDENTEVRAAAQLVLRQHEEDPALPVQMYTENQSLLATKKEENPTMQLDQHPAPISEDLSTVAYTQADAAPGRNISQLSPHKKLARRTTLLMLVATLVLIVGVLTAAGYSWWNYQMGDPNLYTTINQKQTSQGVTINITQVYADEGHTIIAYNIPAVDQGKLYQLEIWKLTGSAPQFKDAQSSGASITYGSGDNKSGADHLYLAQPQFLVPAGSNQLTIHLDITQLFTFLTSGNNKVLSSASTSLHGNWDFTFTVPFHHTNNKHIPDPVE